MNYAFRWIGACLALCSLVAFVFLPGLGGDFILDDLPNIVEKSEIHIESLTADSLVRAAGAYKSGPIGRPLATISLGLDHWLHGLNPFAFKLTNLFFHILNSLLILLLARRLLALDDGQMNTSHESWPAWTALGLAAIWAIHPLQVSTVLYVIQRMEIMALTFILLALLAYMRGRNLQMQGQNGSWNWLVASVFLSALGFLCKETAALFPVFALGLELTLFKFSAFTQKNRRLLKVIFASVFAFMALLFLVVYLPSAFNSDAYIHRNFSLGERLLTQLRVLPFYISLILFPAPDRMLFFYDAFPVSSDLFTPWTTITSALGLAALLITAVLVRLRAPLVTLGIIWFFTAHALTSNVFALELVFEHRNYFAIFPILLCLAALIGLIPKTHFSIPAPAIMFVLVIGLSVITMTRTATWGDSFNLAMHHAMLNPKSERAHTELGVIYGSMADGNPDSIFYDSAIIRLERAARQANASPLPEQALILLAALSGEGAKAQWWDGLNRKLTEQPIGAQEQAAVQRLIEGRVNGLPLSDTHLKQIFETLLERERVPPALIANFGFYALRVLEDRDFAAHAFRAAANKYQASTEKIEKWHSELVEGGYPDVAEALFDS